MKNYPSLHTMTEYSFLQSAIKIDDLITFGIKHKLSALVISDRNNMHGVAEFIHKCKKVQIKPVIGIDLDLKEARVIVLAKNYQGYQFLMTLASLKGANQTIELAKLNNANIFIIDHPQYGLKATNKPLPTWANFFIGVNHNNSQEKQAVFLQETKILNPEDNATLDILNALRTNQGIKNEKVKPYQLLDLNTIIGKQSAALIDQCKIEWPKEKFILPTFANSEKLDSDTFLKKLTKAQLVKLLPDQQKEDKYLHRIEHELNVITKLGFADYFLIIWDLVKYAREQSIIVGPGRGSAAGSLIAFLLEITEIDPLQYNLLFERFLNPERISMPDIDLDIQDTKREQVIKYLFTKYGLENVALISTFQKLGAKSSIRDVARLLQINNVEAIELTKLIPLNTSLDIAFDTSSRFRSAINKNKQNQDLFSIAKKIEGLPRQIGTHAAGIIIASHAINKKAPTLKNTEGFNQVQYAMDYLDDHNLLKIDVLGLRNLTILQMIQQEIKKQYDNRQVNLSKIAMNDNLTNLLFSQADTNGIFQFESFGMKKTLMEVQVNSLDDVAAIVALYRPGPMEFISTYAKRKFKKEDIPKITPAYDQLVANTYGIIVYQEQIMQIAQSFANMSFGQADIMRRAISKKDHSLIASLKKIFITNACAKGADLKVAEEVFRQIEAFANYGFNKSHAVAYATLAYRLAYLKAHFPSAFYIALINSSLGSLSALKTYVNEAKTHNISIQAPDINNSETEVIWKNKVLILPLTIIKGLGSTINEKIMQERQKGTFKDFFDCIARLKLAGMGEPTFKLLIKGNALRVFGNMQTLLEALKQALRYGQMITVKKNEAKILDFNLLPKPTLTKIPLDLAQSVTFEQSMYGFNLASFITSAHEKKDKLNNLKQNGKQTLVVWVEKVRRIYDKTKKPMALVTLLDSSTTIEAWIFNDTLIQFPKLKSQQLVHVQIEYNKKRNNYVINQVWKEINE